MSWPAAAGGSVHELDLRLGTSGRVVAPVM
jgi:hypothetical protein